MWLLYDWTAQSYWHSDNSENRLLKYVRLHFDLWWSFNMILIVSYAILDHKESNLKIWAKIMNVKFWKMIFRFWVSTVLTCNIKHFLHRFKMPADKRRLIYSIVQFLNKELNSDEISEDAKESLEVASQCLQTAYCMAPEDTHLEVSKSLEELFHSATQSEPVSK